MNNPETKQIEKPMGRRICSWCKTDMGPAQTEMDTHGICNGCVAKFYPDIAKKIKEII